MKGRHLICCAGFALVTAAVSAQERGLTIPELIRLRAPAPFYQSRVRELLPPEIREVTSQAELIVLGRVDSSAAYLSDDQEDLYTDYTVTPLRVIRQSIVATSRTPGAVTPIRVKRWGGRTVIDGVNVTFEDQDLRFFERGDELLLFLRRDSEEGKYQLLGLAAFEVTDNTIQPLVRHPRHEQFRGWTLDQLEAAIHGAGDRRAQAPSDSQGLYVSVDGHTGRPLAEAVFEIEQRYGVSHHVRGCAIRAQCRSRGRDGHGEARRQDVTEGDRP